LAREQERRAGGTLRIALEVDSDLRDLPPTAASHVYRIVQEGLTNIVKHANAGWARVALGFRPDPDERDARCRHWLELTIENDGSGAADRRRDIGGNGLGLIGMHERAMALGGHLEVNDLGDRGFKLHAIIPVRLEGPAP
jgi:signal transduction histidine kinase